MSKGKELSNPHLEPTTSRIANPGPCTASPLPLSIPPPLPPRNSNMTSNKQYPLTSLESRSGPQELVDATTQHSFPTMTRVISQNKCLQPYHNKLKLALTIAVLTVVMVTVITAIYTSVTNQKTEISNISKMTEVQMTELQMTEVQIETQTTQVTTANNKLTFNGMSIIFVFLI